MLVMIARGRPQLHLPKGTALMERLQEMLQRNRLIIASATRKVNAGGECRTWAAPFCSPYHRVS